jgi:hypothetical protein
MGGNAGALFMVLLVFLAGMLVMSFSVDDKFWNS